MKLLILSLRTIAVSTAATVLLLLLLGAGTLSIYAAFLSLGLLSLAITTLLKS